MVELMRRSKGGASTVSTTVTRHTTQEGVRTTDSRHTSLHESTSGNGMNRLENLGSLLHTQMLLTTDCSLLSMTAN